MSERSTHVQVTAPGEAEPPQEFALLWFERFLGGSRILVDKMSAEAPNGKYVVEGLEPGKYLVCAVSPDYAPSSFQAVQLGLLMVASLGRRLMFGSVLAQRLVSKTLFWTGGQASKAS
jgi:hypothetical protein